jgi:D-alanine-D-alanine ligase
MPKTTVGVIFGGRSVEHEVSIITAQQVMENMNRDKYELMPIYISKSGDWFCGTALLGMEGFKNLPRLLAKLDRVFLQPAGDKNHLLYLSQGLFSRRRQGRLDVAFPVLHGTYGEDGCLQGLLELVGVPYVGAAVLGSAVGMDKIVMKAVLRDGGLPVVDYVWLSHQEWEDNPQQVIARIEQRLRYPLVIKPANLGSSIGISRAEDRDSLKFAIDVASHYDRRIIVEQGLTDFMEVNCSVIGNQQDLQVSLCEQPLSWQAFLSYEEKYLNTGGKQGMAGASRKLPAPISDDQTGQIQQLALSAFRLLDCRGIARLDFLLDKGSGRPYVNEINTMPGSISYYLWEPLGITFDRLIDRLIELALEAHQQRTKYICSYDTNLLSVRSQGLKGKFS